VVGRTAYWPTPDQGVHCGMFATSESWRSIRSPCVVEPTETWVRTCLSPHPPGPAWPDPAPRYNNFGICKIKKSRTQKLQSAELYQLPSADRIMINGSSGQTVSQ
jgi:hypothetical protein